ncbi:MAG: polyphosphate kinase 2 [Vicinamibacterales bacterium]
MPRTPRSKPPRRPPSGDPLPRRVRDEMLDSFDEELEHEIDDERLTALLTDVSREGPGTPPTPAPGAVPRRGRPASDPAAAAPAPVEQARGPIDREVYFRELFRLQAELVKFQDWVVARKLKVVVLFEGRDAAGKGGAIKRITQRLNPRVCRVAALPVPTERERTQWYFQRYVAHLPAAGEIVLFDRSWYNRAGVEKVMGFCSDEEYEEFFRSVPDFEKMLVRSGITLIKYWFSISDEEQHLRFKMRIHDPLKQWKLSPMDLESRRRWEDYTKAKEVMIRRTHIAEAPWWIVEADDKKRARLNCIHHLLQQIPYREITLAPVLLPRRVRHPDYSRAPLPHEIYIPEIY